MKNVLLLNLHQKYEGFANGHLNGALVDVAEQFFIQKGFKTQKTTLEEGYSLEHELKKFEQADLFFVQSPVYWMGLPWRGKQYIDEVFSGGKGSVTFINDGRDIHDITKRYGTGGLLSNKKYMLSFTYNCPKSEFNNPQGFYKGMSVDEGNIALHKTFQFCGASPLETFSVHDVYHPNFSFDTVQKEFTNHLENVFGC